MSPFIAIWLSPKISKWILVHWLIPGAEKVHRFCGLVNRRIVQPTKQFIYKVAKTIWNFICKVCRATWDFVCRVAKACWAVVCKVAKALKDATVKTAKWTNSNIIQPTYKGLCWSADKSWKGACWSGNKARQGWNKTVETAVACKKWTYTNILAPLGVGARDGGQWFHNHCLIPAKDAGKRSAEFVYNKALVPTARFTFVTTPKWIHRNVLTPLYEKVLKPTFLFFFKTIPLWLHKNVYLKFIKPACLYLWKKFCQLCRFVFITAPTWLYKKILKPTVLFIWKWLIVAPLKFIFKTVPLWIHRNVLKPTAHLIWFSILKPLGRMIRTTVKALIQFGHFCFRKVIKPGGGGLRKALLKIKRLITICSTWLWNTILVPIGKAIRYSALMVVKSVVITGYLCLFAMKWVTTNVLIPIKKAFVELALWTYDKILTPVGHFSMYLLHLVFVDVPVYTYAHLMLPLYRALCMMLYNLYVGVMVPLGHFGMWVANDVVWYAVQQAMHALNTLVHAILDGLYDFWKWLRNKLG
eukprot:TRINITY_DN61176_c0_g2_i1.p1 TRINITY_DN61176_c0_g2~~TRINITY_DN61176_c0_g2_i1.p1  ORF type:complete len:525 (-),score=18.18 TRINITY_DN61176_c0_g2_i1:90-1664(-)